jgi:hypothetical protein
MIFEEMLCEEMIRKEILPKRAAIAPDRYNY